ncbi:IS5 family transposase [Sulfurivermis fontis]|uniref:IS5 family transposase n=1 Tax=Sulfurivermis fontis TaxID=1972068 RepID=UPI000FDAC7F6|nr:IS5 family transposase [Sulfurivermis fontis]
MKQLSMTTGFEKYTKATKRQAFLSDMDRLLPWAELCALIAPHYPQAGNGRPPKELEMMLRIHFLQQWFNLSDPMAEEALYDSLSMRAFAGIDLGEHPVPDETTICRFRHLLEQHGLGRKLFQQMHQYLQRHGFKLGTGTIVDATLISAPSSTKNKDQQRDPDMHQTKKGNQWYFGMKAHVGVDHRTKLIHSVVATAANVHDSHCLPDLLHGDETRVWGDSAYQGQTEVIKQHAPRARDLTHRRYRYKGWVDEAERAKNRLKSTIRARVEHSIGVIKRIFGFAKTRYRGLEKNANRLFVTCALANIYLVRRQLLRTLQA